MYSLIYSPTSKEGLAKLRKSDPSAFRKAVNLLNELMEHPTTGTGHPHPFQAIVRGNGLVRLLRNIDLFIKSTNVR